ncbi:MAG: P1 family peptidase [Betaproteobacteria bacterium]|nr:P1 family peptidase [Betaproteobacteria bacterium]
MKANSFEAPRIGTLTNGEKNTIADVGSVTVGHATLSFDNLQTGVTVVRPHAGNPYVDKAPAAAVVINGFGKSVGLIQINELGTLETPIALTTTLSVGTVAQAMVRQAIVENPEIGRAAGTVNPVVFECNDGYLNDTQALAITEAHYREALAAATKVFAQGAVGAGRGMSCFGLKGGIGSASRRTSGGDWTVGVLVLANFGRLSQLMVKGVPLGALASERLAQRESQALSLPDKGSIIVIMATDAPLDYRQLRRLAMRAGAGLARTGSNYGHGSGDIALAFSTAYTIPHTAPSPPLLDVSLLAESAMDTLFDAAAEATEQAIVHALFHAQTVTGFVGHTRYALPELLPDWRALL